MSTPTEHVTRSRSLIMKYPGGAFAYRHPRTVASMEFVVGIWLLILGVILCAYGYWWGASLFVAMALPFWVAYQVQRADAQHAFDGNPPHGHAQDGTGENPQTAARPPDQRPGPAARLQSAR